MPFTFKLSKRLAQMHATDPSLVVVDGLLPRRSVSQLVVSPSLPRYRAVVSPSQKVPEGVS